MGPRSTLAGLAFVSAAWLAFEIALTRVLAIQQFHHFAFLVVSLAVLASSASGLILTLRPRPPSLARLSLALTASILLAYVTLGALPFDSFRLVWDPLQALILLVYFLTASLPFLMAGWITGACLAHAGLQVHRVYAANLGGAAVGCLGSLVALEVLRPESLVVLAAGGAALAAAAFAKSSARWAWGLLAALVVLVAPSLPDQVPVQLSPYKPLAYTRLALGARTSLTDWDATSRIDVIEAPGIHILPGLSLNAQADLPDQAAIFIDGDGPLPLTRLSPDTPQAAALAARMPGSLAYQLRPAARALILDGGGALDASLALASGARFVSLSIDDPAVVRVLQHEYAEYTGQLLDDPRIDLVSRSSRGALGALASGFDVVQFALSDPYHPVTSGAFTLTEDYTLTIEAMREAFRLLDPEGILVLTRWLQTPPSESGRAFALLLEALDAEGISDPSLHVVAYRSMRTATFLVARRPFTTGELDAVRGFLHANAFDPIHLPDLAPEEVNRYNRLPIDAYAELARSLLSAPEQTLVSYEFDLRPPTDDHPFFFHFFRWRQTPSLVARLGQTWEPFGGSGYLVLLALLGLMIILALPLVVAPMVMLRRQQAPTPESGGYGAMLLFFACLGAGFMLVEIPLLQRLTHLLDRPSISLAVVLFTLLLSSGCGSLFLASRANLGRCLGGLCLAILALTLALPPAIRAAIAWMLPARLALTFALLAIPGVLMGIPFASGLQRLASRPRLIPWAWAANGAAAGLSGVIAALISLSWGITAALLVGAAAYAIASFAARRI